MVSPIQARNIKSVLNVSDSAPVSQSGMAIDIAALILDSIAKPNTSATSSESALPIVSSTTPATTDPSLAPTIHAPALADNTMASLPYDQTHAILPSSSTLLNTQTQDSYSPAISTKQNNNSLVHDPIDSAIETLLNAKSISLTGLKFTIPVNLPHQKLTIQQTQQALPQVAQASSNLNHINDITPHISADKTEHSGSTIDVNAPETIDNSIQNSAQLISDDIYNNSHLSDAAEINHNNALAQPILASNDLTPIAHDKTNGLSHISDDQTSNEQVSTKSNSDIISEKIETASINNVNQVNITAAHDAHITAWKNIKNKDTDDVNIHFNNESSTSAPNSDEISTSQIAHVNNKTIANSSPNDIAAKLDNPTHTQEHTQANIIPAQLSQTISSTYSEDVNVTSTASEKPEKISNVEHSINQNNGSIVTTTQLAKDNQDNMVNAVYPNIQTQTTNVSENLETQNNVYENAAPDTADLPVYGPHKSHVDEGDQNALGPVAPILSIKNLGHSIQTVESKNSNIQDLTLGDSDNSSAKTINSQSHTSLNEEPIFTVMATTTASSNTAPSIHMDEHSDDDSTPVMSHKNAVTHKKSYDKKIDDIKLDANDISSSAPPKLPIINEIKSTEPMSPSPAQADQHVQLFKALTAEMKPIDTKIKSQNKQELAINVTAKNNVFGDRDQTKSNNAALETVDLDSHETAINISNPIYVSTKQDYTSSLPPASDVIKNDESVIIDQPATPNMTQEQLQNKNQLALESDSGSNPVLENTSKPDLSSHIGNKNPDLTTASSVSSITSNQTQSISIDTTSNALPSLSSSAISSSSSTQSSTFQATQQNAAPQTAQTETYEPKYMFVKQIINALHDGKSELRLSLYPAQLGQVVIAMSLEGQHLSVDLKTTSQQATDALTLGEDSLKDALTREGFILDSFAISDRPNEEKRRQQPQKRHAETNTPDSKTDIQFSIDMIA